MGKLDELIHSAQIALEYAEGVREPEEALGTMQVIRGTLRAAIKKASN